MRNLDIAVIGLGCRVPGAATVEQLWDNLIRGRESIITFSDEELRREGISEQLLQDSCFVKAGVVLEAVTDFDASFFGFTPAEAQSMDLQQRIFLELVWEVIEEAGYNSHAYKRPIGVYAGMGTNQREYLSSGTSQGSSLALSELINREKDFLATIAAYKLNLKGPAITVQTGCSTSLVAVHLACQGLLTGDCALAIAGGVSIAGPAEKGYLYESGGILSPDGHCRAFDAQANGTVPGSGAGVVLLKRLKDAVADGDIVHAVIRGSAINNDGSLKVGYTAPSVEGQAKVVMAAQLAANAVAESISYIEAHGTATALGDPIEIAALTQAFRATTRRTGFCAIGSIKTNIGHLNTAAGALGLIKTILALKHKQLPPSLHFQAPNPKIRIESTPFFVNSEVREWTGPLPLRAGVSSFGIGGTNAHVIVEEAPEKQRSAPGHPEQLLVLSARTQTALDIATANLANHLRRHPPDNLADVAYTLQVGRREFGYRRTLVCRTPEEAVERLEDSRVIAVRGEAADAEGRPIVFMFPGQGAQFVGMGQQIYEEERSFRQVVDRCSEKLRPFLGVDLRELLYPVEEKREWAGTKLEQTAITQPAMFVVNYALAGLWMQWGIKPQAVLGHSVGEYVAACLAGVMDEHDALRLVSWRGQLMQEQPSGRMLAVGLSEKQTREELRPGLWLAAVNGPEQCVLSGTEAAIEEVHKRLESRLVRCHRLRVSHAFHSGMMERALTRFAEVVTAVKLHQPQLPYISNISGDWITAQEATNPEYWVRHLREPVHFNKGIKKILHEFPKAAFLEVGPGESLAGMVREEGNNRKQKLVVASSFPGASDGIKRERASLLKAAGKLWTAGAQVDWNELHRGEKRSRVSLPTYPFEKKRCWISRESAAAKAASPQEKKTHADIADWFYVPVWKQALFRQTEAPQTGQEWLIFLDDTGVTGNLREQLIASGNRIVSVNMGESFTVEQDAFAINPAVPDHYAALLAELIRRKRIPNRILHLWSIPVKNETGNPSFEAEYAGLISLLFLAQGLDAQDVSSPIQLTVVSSNAHLITGEEAISPASATVLGACVVIPQEYPNLRCHCIDISLSDFSATADLKYKPAFVRELMLDRADGLTAYRRGRRWVRIFEKVQFPEAKSTLKRLQTQGVYLITGGLGNIGLEIAEYLARQVRAKLVLMGRTEFPAQEKWDDCLHQGSKDDEDYRRLKKLCGLRDMGAEILVASGDVSQPEDVRQVILETHKKFGRIQGVIHAAAYTSPQSMKSIANLTLEDIKVHFHPKVIGLQVLHTALANEPIEFMVLLSSLSVIVGGIGYSAYAAANVFMDAFCHWWGQKSSLSCSINWGGWDFLLDAERRRAGGGESAHLILPQEGIEALHRLFQQDEFFTQIAVSTVDFRERSLQRVEHRVDRSASYHPPINETENRLTQVLEKALGVPEISRNDTFVDLGVHSLLALEIIGKLRTLFDVKLRVADIYSHDDVAGLSQYIDRLLSSGSAGLEARSPVSAGFPKSGNGMASSNGAASTSSKAILPLVRLRSTGSKPPLYLAHPAGGDVRFYRELVKFLREDQPVIALQDDDQDMAGQQCFTLEEMAARYIEAVRAVHTQGPYVLGGWSMGAVLAFEMAAQLKMQAEDVLFLAMIDPPIYASMFQGGNSNMNDSDSLIEMAHHLMMLAAGKETSWMRHDLQGMERPERIRFVLHYLQQEEIVHRDVTEATFSQAINTFSRHARAVRSYYPKKQNGPVLLIQAAERDPQAPGFLECQMWWKRLVEGPFTVREVPGNHFTMMRGCNLEVLAATLQKYLDVLGSQ